MPDFQNKTVVIISIAISALLLVGVVGAYRSAKSRTSTIVLPGGITYLGPNTSPAPQPASPYIPIPADAAWSTQKGTVLPYTFLYPASLSLGIFPGDPFDSVTIFWQNTNSQENIFFRVENLNNLKGQQKYVGRPKLEYAQNWWRQYSWKGVSDVSPFTNSNGLKGYRAKYVDAAGKTPHDNIFFEVPTRPELVIWMASRLVEPTIFDKMVDSVTWQQ